jgi:HEPN domain-containing protein
MTGSFDDQLARVEGTIHRVNMANDFERFRDGLLYYVNRAEALHDGARLVVDGGGPSEPFTLLAGLSLEVLLKGIHRALDKKIPFHHRLHNLSSNVGIALSDDDRIILEALSEHVYWASRYPVPASEENLLSARAVFAKQRRTSGNLANYYIAERHLSVENYERLWGLFLGYYERARSARLESAELIYNRGLCRFVGAARCGRGARRSGQTRAFARRDKHL